MWAFLYVLAAMGVAFWAKRDGRRADVWFAVSLLLTPIGSIAALTVADRYSL